MGEKINSSASEMSVIAIWRLQRVIIDMRFFAYSRAYI